MCAGAVEFLVYSRVIPWAITGDEAMSAMRSIVKCAGHVFYVLCCPKKSIPHFSVEYNHDSVQEYHSNLLLTNPSQNGT